MPPLKKELGVVLLQLQHTPIPEHRAPQEYKYQDSDRLRAHEVLLVLDRLTRGNGNHSLDDVE